ncbi:Kar3 member kinesin-like protein [Corchorus olitorius]|uniref:Kar3 member kinesin-like protein n=1 Tax=Corchorus olitorius TaxID=93759 RepID=A0A1R3GQL8_9ROSI|nr:Kar3 member kinesin-like protein [Corchorus olitorius]
MELATFDNKVPSTPSTTHPSDCMETSKDLKLKHHKKKKKRAKHNWSSKKSHSKVVNGTPCAPEILEDDNYISDEDIHFRNNMFRREAIETLKIGQFLGLSFKDKDENIINKLVELEYEDWKMHSIT